MALKPSTISGFKFQSPQTHRILPKKAIVPTRKFNTAIQKEGRFFKFEKRRMIDNKKKTNFVETFKKY